MNMFRSILVLGLFAVILAIPLLAATGADETDGHDRDQGDHSWSNVGSGHPEILGARLSGLTPELREHMGAPRHRGVLVSSILEESPAAIAGLQIGDVIARIDGWSVDSVRDAREELRQREGGDVELEVYRESEMLTLTAGLNEAPARRSWSGHYDDHDLDYVMDDLGAELDSIGEEIGASVAMAFESVDWQELDDIIEDSLEISAEAMEAVDWEGMETIIEQSISASMDALSEIDFSDSWDHDGRHDDRQDRHWQRDHEIDLEEMERHIEEMEQQLEQSLQRLERQLDDLD